MRVKKAILSIAAASILLTGCVDYEGLVQEQQNAHEEELQEEEKIEVLLGDINDDGKEEKLILDDAILNLYSGARICEKFNVPDEYQYSSMSTLVSDIDGDSANEIVALLYCDNRDENLVSNIVIINQDENGQFKLCDFPEEVTSNYADSGFGAEVTLKDKFIYSVSVDSYKYDVDVSRMYGLSMLDKEGVEKAEEKWEKIEKSNYFGEVLGIYGIDVVRDAEGNNSLYVYEYVTGGDDKVIGSLVFVITYDKDGQYQIENVMFKELG